MIIASDEVQSRNEWKFGRVAEVYASDDNFVRKVKLAMADSTLDKRRKRPVSYSKGQYTS